MLQNSSLTENKPNLDYIQALRALAALMVVLHHAKAFLVGTVYEKLSFDLFWPGAFGVDLFFIISGFIIVYTSYDYTRKDLPTFIKKRFIRIWPLYFIATMIYALLFKNTDLSTMHGFVYSDKIDAVQSLNIIKSLLFIPLNFYDPVYFGAATLFVGWTLNYEVYFYIVCATGLLFSRNKYWFYALWFLTTLFIIPSFMGLATTIRPTIENGGYFNLTIQSVVWEFVFGACVAILFKKNMLRIKDPKKAIPLILIAFAIPAYGYVTKRNTMHGVEYFGMYYCIMFFLLTSCHQFIKDSIKIPKTILSIGDASYSLYLLHPIVFIVLFKLKERLLPTLDYQNFYFMFISAIVSILVSILSYNYLEKKLINIYKK